MPAILPTEHVAKVIERARGDSEKGVYYAFPFLTGTRPSEQLALLWEDVDFDTNVICLRRMQEPDGSITNYDARDRAAAFVTFFSPPRIKPTLPPLQRPLQEACKAS